MQIFEIIGECVCVGGRGVISLASSRSRRGSEPLVTVDRKSMDRKNASECTLLKISSHKTIITSLELGYTRSHKRGMQCLTVL